MHPYTFRDEAHFVTEHLDDDAQKEYAVFFGPPSGAQQQAHQSPHNATPPSAGNTTRSVRALGSVRHRQQTMLLQSHESDNTGDGGDACLSPFPAGGGVDGVFTEFIASAAGALKLNSTQWDLPAVNREPQLERNCLIVV